MSDENTIGADATPAPQDDPTAAPYIGEVRMFAGNYAPVGWMICDGTLLDIADYQPLFQLLGTTFGGDGQTTFAIPDLRSRVPLHMSGNPGYGLGARGGAEAVRLTVQQIPAHSHALQATKNEAHQTIPDGEILARTTPPLMLYGTGAPGVQLAPQMVASTGGSQPHINIQPYLAINFMISLYGIFPTQN